jgi:hypothetical protein
LAKQDLPAEFLKRLKTITAKRPKTVIDHILKHGFVTTEELKNLYGYNHAPRAAMDVKDHGIPLEGYKVTNDQGRTIRAYRFADESKLRAGFSGRRAFSKELKQAVMEANDSRCKVCLSPHDLQIDHRVPYAVVGDLGFDERDPTEYMALCRLCNRAKSWCCEHCENWLKFKDPKICERCYWASPDSYVHIALREERRLDVVWTEKDVAVYDKIKKLARSADVPMPEYVKVVLGRAAKSK